MTLSLQAPAAFKPAEYLQEYYSYIGDENDALLEFFAKAYRYAAPDSLDIIEIGGGPTVYQLISAARSARTICFTDLLSSNLSQIRSFVDNDKTAFSWQSFARRALTHEHPRTTVGIDAASKRLDLLRTKLRSVRTFNALTTAAKGLSRSAYDVVSTNFVAESATTTHEDWEKMLGNMLTFMKPTGTLLMCGLLEASHWNSGQRYFGAYYVDYFVLLETLDKLGLKAIRLEIVPAEQAARDADSFKGFAGMFMVQAIRKPNR